MGMNEAPTFSKDVETELRLTSTPNLAHRTQPEVSMCQGKQAGYRRRDFTAKPVRRAQPSSRLLWVRRSTDWFQADPSEGDSRSITRRRANCPNRTQACYEIHVPQYTSGQLGRDCRVMRSEGYSERLETNWAIRTEDRRATGATRESAVQVLCRPRLG